MKISTLLLSCLIGFSISAMASAIEEREETYGVCVIAPENTNSVPGVDLSPGRHLHKLMARSLHQDVLRELATGYPSAKALERFWQWEKDLKIRVISNPKHGTIIGENHGYMQSKNFIGKDSVELIAEGNDINGKVISAKLIYFINIMPRKKYHGWADTAESHLGYLKKYCGKTKERWRISNTPSTSGTMAPQQQSQ